MNPEDWHRLAEQWQLPPELKGAFVVKKPTHIIGADECGTGALAGPVMVCAAVVPVQWRLPGLLNDSKKLTRRQRVQVQEELHQKIEYVTHLIPSERLDEIGLTATLEEGYTKTIEWLLADYPDAFVIIDGNRPYFEKAHTLVKGDGKVPAIMAASVCGKVLRDFHMVEMDIKYPGYDFKNCVGYNSAKHKKGIERLGLSPLHRKSYGDLNANERKRLARAAVAQG